MSYLKFRSLFSQSSTEAFITITPEALQEGQGHAQGDLAPQGPPRARVGGWQGVGVAVVLRQGRKEVSMAPLHGPHLLLLWPPAPPRTAQTMDTPPRPLASPPFSALPNRPPSRMGTPGVHDPHQVTFNSKLCSLKCILILASPDHKQKYFLSSFSTNFL